MWWLTLARSALTTATGRKLDGPKRFGFNIQYSPLCVRRSLTLYPFLEHDFLFLRLPPVRSLYATNRSECHYYNIFPTASHYLNGILSLSCPWDDRRPHPPSSALSTAFNNLPNRSWSKTFVQRLITTCAHPFQDITRPIIDHHSITSRLRANMKHIDEGEAQTFTLPACSIPPVCLTAIQSLPKTVFLSYL